MLTPRRKTTMAYANEGAEKAKQEEELANRKRKVEEHAKWEGELYYPFITNIPPSGRRRC